MITRDTLDASRVGHVLVAGRAPTLVPALRNWGAIVAEVSDLERAAEALWSDPQISVIAVTLGMSGVRARRLIEAASAALGRSIETVMLPSPPDDSKSLAAVIEALRQQAIAEESGSFQNEVEKLFKCLAVAAEHKDNETGHHNRRIGCYAATLAKTLGWSADRCRTLELAASLHDIGKIGIPDEILFKCTPLTAEERTRVEHHTIAGYQILSAANSPVLICAAQIARHHHERWCGGGYPFGIAGDNIPIEARITAVCDVYDALRSPRAYKAGFAHHLTMSILMEGDHRTRPDHFDPIVLEAMGQVASSFETIYSQMSEI